MKAIVPLQETLRHEKGQVQDVQAHALICCLIPMRRELRLLMSTGWFRRLCGETVSCLFAYQICSFWHSSALQLNEMDIVNSDCNSKENNRVNGRDE
jgi:hypothetical protein